MRNKEITIYDIAKELKLSASTVSRALNDNKVINKNTRKRVSEYAESIGYQTNTFASNLHKQTTKTIGVIVPTLDSKFVSSFLAGAEKVAGEKGFSLLISQSLEDFNKEKFIAKSMFKKRVDGLLISLAKSSSETSPFKPFYDRGTPVLFFDRTPSDSQLSTYTIDNYEAAYSASSHLISQGCKRMLHITLNSNLAVYNKRELGFKQAIHDAHLKVKGKTFALNDLNLNSGKEIAKKVASLNVDGVFFANDKAAIGCMIELQKLGIRIPEDIAMIGFNNDPVCELTTPSFSSVNYPATAMGTLVTNHIIEHILGNSNINIANQIILKSELIVRDSSKKSTADS